MRHLGNSWHGRAMGSAKFGEPGDRNQPVSRAVTADWSSMWRGEAEPIGVGIARRTPPPRSARYSETQAIADYRRAASGRAVRSTARSARPSPPRRHSAAGKRPRCSRSPPTCRTSAWPSHQYTEPRLRRAGPNRDPGQTRRASGRACRRRPRAERGRRQLPLRAYLIVDGGMTIGGFEPYKMEDAAHGATNGSYVGEAG